MMAEKYHLTREQLDDFAYQSHSRAGAAIQDGRLAEQIAPVPCRRWAGGTRRG